MVVSFFAAFSSLLLFVLVPVGLVVVVVGWRRAVSGEEQWKELVFVRWCGCAVLVGSFLLCSIQHGAGSLLVAY